MYLVERIAVRNARDADAAYRAIADALLASSFIPERAWPDPAATALL
jgi:hypothetical protein